MDGPRWNGTGNLEAVNLTRRRGDAEEETEKAKKERERRFHAMGGVAERAEKEREEVRALLAWVKCKLVDRVEKPGRPVGGWTR